MSTSPGTLTTTLLTTRQERTWIQCLHAKSEGWEPESGDEDYEIDAKDCFVTGISKEGVDEFDATGFQPVKHGVKDCMINNIDDEHPVSGSLIAKARPSVRLITYIEQQDESWGLPMHPTCFEMYASLPQPTATSH